MKFTKLGLEVLDKLLFLKDKASRRLRRTSERVIESDKQAKPKESELAEHCWLQCKGLCAPFRQSGRINTICKLCPGNPPKIPL